MLNSAGVIEIQAETQDIIKFKFAQSKDFASIVNLPDYETFINAIKSMENYRLKLSNASIEEIKPNN
ncbi:MAG: hypothetical protein MZV64_26375 [Ignavibacteriales bacterium]|nr:hypothetical protein [Ignavibacteriales bacterium]